MDQPPQAVSETLPASRTLIVLRRIFRRLWLRVGLVAVLEVPGRRTGTPTHVIVAPWKVGETMYLMSQYGVSNWVRNLRAAGRGELRLKGRGQAFSAIEVDGDERDRVLAVFNAKTPKPFNKDFNRRPAPADHPTFRVVPIS